MRRLEPSYKRGMLTNLQNGILEYPLLADGVAPDKLYPLNVDRSLKKLDSIRNDTIFAPNVGVLQQDVASGQVDMFMLADSRDVCVTRITSSSKFAWMVFADAGAIHIAYRSHRGQRSTQSGAPSSTAILGH